MSGVDPHDLSLALQRWRDGVETAGPEVWEQAYEELKGMARRLLRELPLGASVQPTGLVHEAWLKLAGDSRPPENRRHFFFAAGRAMRDVLVERARARLRLKRGGDRRRIDLAEIEAAASAQPECVLEVASALERLAAFQPRLARLVELRFFAGLTAEEAAAAFETSLSSVERDWRLARAWLYRELSAPGPAGEGRTAGRDS